MRAFVLAMGGVIALTAPTPAISADADPATYLLSLRMANGSRVIGSPKLTVAAGRPSRIQLRDTVGNRYSISVTATPKTADTVYVASSIDITSGAVHRTSNPKILMVLGRQTGITLGRAGSAKPFHVDFTIAKAI